MTSQVAWIVATGVFFVMTLGSIDFTDVLLLLKIDGEWKCVAKAYNQNSNTITK